MLARPGAIPTRGDWTFELKGDGFRAIVSTEGAPLRVRSRRGWVDFQRRGNSAGPAFGNDP